MVYMTSSDALSPMHSEFILSDFRAKFLLSSRSDTWRIKGGLNPN